jgi:hypothetical protein
MFGTTSSDPRNRATLAMDPGETTGVCLLLPPFDVVMHNQLESAAAVAALLRSYQGDLDFMTIVYEKFQVAPSVASRLSWNHLPAPQVIGVIESFCQEHRIKPVLQSPAQKRFFDNRKMKLLGAYWPSMPHAVDAARHAFYHAIFTQGWGKDDKVHDVLRGLEDDG